MKNLIVLQHDFRMTDGGKRVNLIFDLVVPRDKEYDKEEIIKNVQQKIHEKDKKYFAVIKVETSYI